MRNKQDRNPGTNSTGPNGAGIVEEETTLRTASVRSRISWGAIAAGTLLTLAMAWLLTLLGTAIGVNILDASDLAAIGTGFAIGTGIWMILTALGAFFAGAFLTAHLAGRTNRMDGLLHGISLWSLATVLMLVLTYWGIAGILKTGASAVGSTVSAVANTTQSGGQALSGRGPALAQAGAALMDSKIADEVIVALKRNAAGLISEQAGADVTRSQARQMIDQIDPDALKTIALHLITGDVQAAKNALAANTALRADEIDTIVDNSIADVQQTVDAFQQQAGALVESASSYAQATLWMTFISALLALAVSLAGGWVGAACVQRDTVTQRRRNVSNK